MEGQIRRVIEITNVIDNYSKSLYKSGEQTQDTDELQLMITGLLNELLECVDIDYQLPLVEFLPVNEGML